MKVFISSTSEDLAAYRQAARDVVLDLGWLPVMMEHFGTDGFSPIAEACARRVGECDLVLALVAWRRGSLVEPAQDGGEWLSYTALEVEAAKRARKPVLVLLADDSWPRRLCEKEAGAIAWVEDFRRKLDRLAVSFAWEEVRAGAKKPLPIFQSIVREELVRHERSLRGASRQEAPEPVETSEEARQIGEALKDAYRRLKERTLAGLPEADVRQEIGNLKRRQVLERSRLQPHDLLAEGRFELRQLLGQGGFATVWLAWDEERHRKVAVKALHGQFADDRTRRERFVRGARKMAELGHPGIVRVLEGPLADGGHHFFVMEYLPGGDLRQVVLKGRLGAEGVLALVRQVGEALQSAHEQGVIHRDVKPANVLLDAAGSPKLTDFDLMRALDSAAGTRTGSMGTFLYTAPEVMDRPQEAGPAADLYSLAMTAVFCLYGKDLPAGEVLGNRQAFLAKLSCTSAVRQVLEKALSWQADERYSSVAAFLTALEEAAARREPPERPVPKREEPRRPRPEPPVLIALVEKEIKDVNDRPPFVLTAVERALPLAGEVDAYGAAAWLLDYFPGRSAEAAVRERARKLREEALAPLRQRHPPPALPRPGDPDWVKVPGGRFQMGSPEGVGHSDERPAHPVSLSPFRLLDHPVTSGELRLLLPDHQGEAELPAVGMSWYAAYAYAAWLGGRLPTEAEWEYAARAGCPHPYCDRHGRETTLDRVGWYSGNSERKLHPVRQLEPNPWGLYDMIGNVWEWVADWYAPYSGQEQADPWGPPGGDRRVLRGGSYWDDADGARAAYRNFWDPEIVLRGQGFRVVLPPSPSSSSLESRS